MFTFCVEYTHILAHGKQTNRHIYHHPHMCAVCAFLFHFPRKAVIADVLCGMGWFVGGVWVETARRVLVT